MKNSILIFFAITLSSLFFLDCFMFPESEIAGSFKTEKAKLETVNNNVFAVVELFTSEGCSSCPPADELLAKLQREAGNKNIYLLAYHVDYWDRLGWKDQFSSNEFTKRQQKYLDWLNLYVMYTPQFIINGTTEFAGYNESALYEKVSNALKTKTMADLNLTVKSNKDSLEINYTTNLLQKDINLVFATIQKQAISKVFRGENQGATLRHIQIVKQLNSFQLNKKEGNVKIVQPDNFNPKDFEIIGFIQDNRTGKISITKKADKI
ncbi:DUF1223 domain-containing protein [Flavobacterium saccharophilum]|uniref:DUF1223 domain-containing protein n=1 Tax=Flavobacterium saccharophilum TaxID=29534 RepID=A0A1M7IGJ7_9FLAO|nr:DUF1223 domain-containing protein [Flavobacterium saccharophilum]SHM39871.1 Protein of unknown function [Flavobacterium saccharophilum]